MITKHATSRTLLVHTQPTMDALRVEHYRQRVKTCLDEGYSNVIIDMTQTEFINSSGLGWLVELFQHINRSSGTIKILNASERVRWLFHQSQLDQLLTDALGAAPEEGVRRAEVETRFDGLHELMSTEIFLLTQINHVISQALKLDDPQQMGAEILQGAREMTQSEFGCLLLLDEQQQHLRLWHETASGQGRTLTRRRYDNQVPIRIGRLEQRLLASDEVLWQSMEDSDETDTQLFREFGFTRLLAAPIRGKKRAFGLLALEGTDKTQSLLYAAKPLLSTFTQICGQAFENAALNRELRDRNQELGEAMKRLRSSHQSLINAGRLAAMGTVVSGVGHQLNNKLVPVMGYCQLLAQQKTLPQEALGRIDMIQVASSEMRVIIDKLLRLAKVRERIVTTLEPHECVHIALDLLSGHIETQKIRLELDLIEKAPELKGDADLLLQALLAILHRSCTSFTVEQSYRWLKVATHQSGAFFHIQIEDNGTGLGTYDSDDMLDPLVPLEEIGHGQIFSYNIPRNVIRRHGGLLHVKDRDSGGKCATIDLPLH